MSILDRLRGSTVASRLLAAETSREGDRATTLELFFDLVYAFAFTQVTALMLHGGNGISVLQGLIMLALLWAPWCSFAWLANQAHADRGITRIGMIAATVIVFVAAFVVPGAFREGAHGDLAPALVFSIAYLLVQLLHMVVYLRAAGSDAALRRQVLLTELSALVPGAGMLIIGALVGPPFQLWLWLAVVVLQWLMIYLTSNGGAGGNWRVQSAAHFAERHALVVLLALGESVVAIGAGATALPVSTTVIVAAVLAILLGLGLWWSYFHHLSAKTEQAVGRRVGADRARLAADTYTFLHFPIIAGIVLAALGIEQTMHEATGWAGVGWLAACALGGGVSLYLAGTGFVWRRVSGEWAVVRFAGAVLALLLVPLLAFVPALIALALEVVVVIAIAIVEELLGQRGKLPALSRARAGLAGR